MELCKDSSCNKAPVRNGWCSKHSLIKNRTPSDVYNVCLNCGLDTKSAVDRFCVSCKAEIPSDVRRKWRQRQHYHDNKDHYSEYRRNNPITPERQKIYNIKKQYGLNEEEYLVLYSVAGYCCNICGHVPDVTSTHFEKLYLDHDHQTKVPRGFLCASCNFGLGNFKDNVELLTKAIEYLGRETRWWKN